MKSFHDTPYTSKMPGSRSFREMRWIFRLISKYFKTKHDTTWYKDADLDFINKTVEDGEISVTWLGHATILIRTDGKTFIFDPIFWKSIGGLSKRLVPVPIAVDELPKIDYCFVSHDHYDHCSPRTIGKIDPGRIITGIQMKDLFPMNDVVEMDWWQSETLDDGVTVTFIPAKHWSRRIGAPSYQRLWGGFVIEIGNKKIYFAGDTAYCDAGKLVKEKFGEIDLAIIPIGSYMPEFITAFHMNPEQAFTYAGDVGAKAVVPIHWGTYLLAMEPQNEPIERFTKLYKDNPATDQRCLALKIGETVII